MRARHRSLLALLLAGGAACPGAPDGGSTGHVAMALELPGPVALAVTSVVLQVFDERAACVGDDAAGGGLLGQYDLRIGEPTAIEVSAGRRTFFAIAFDGTRAIARGCAPLTLAAGRATELTLALAAYPGDVDAPPAPPDARPVPDAPSRPANDLCDRPEPLPAGETVSGTTLAAGDEHAGACGGGGAPDVTYRFTLAEPARATLTAAADPAAAARLTLRRACDDPTTEIACAGPDGGGVAVLETGALPAGSYAVLVDAATASAPGPFTLRLDLEPVAGPAHDTCADPRALTPGTPAVASLDGAWDDAEASCGPGARPELFFTLELDGPHRVELQAHATAGLDPGVSLRTACADPATELACADDSTGSSEWLLARELPAGRYAVVVEAAGGTGAVEVQADVYPPPPANDLCAAAAPLAPGTPAAGDTTWALDDADTTCGGSDAPDVFYRFTLAEAHEVSLALSGAAGEATLALWSGACDAASPLACLATAGAGEPLVHPHLPAGEYQVVVESAAGTGSPFDLLLTLTPPVPPADECRMVLPLVDEVHGDLADAGDDAAGACGGAGAVDEVHGLSLPGARRVTLTTAASFPHALHLRSTCDEPATEVGCVTSAGGSATLEIGNLPGGTYFAWLERTDGVAAGEYDLFLATGLPQVPPVNDGCPGTAIAAGGATLPGTLAYATDSTAPTCGGAGGADVFYHFSLAAPRRVRATATGAGLDPVLELRSACADAGSALACADVSTSGAETLEVLELGPGDYTLVVDAGAGAAGDFTLTVQLLDPPPPNDACGAAAELIPGVAAAGQTVAGAADDLLGSGACAAPGAADVVYTFETATEARAVVTLTSDFNAAVALRAADCALGAQQACANASAAPGGATETIDVPLLPPGRYFVVVERVAGVGSSFDVRLDLLPPGDGCASPLPLAAGAPRTLSTAGGRADDAAGSCGGAGGSDAAFTFTTAAAQRVRLDVTNALFAHALYLRRGDCGSAAAEVEDACDASSGGASRLDVLDLPAGTYFVFVDAAAGAGGAFTILLTLEPPVPAPPNDTCLAPDPLPGTSAGTLWGAHDDLALACNAAGGLDAVYTFTLAQRSQVTFSATAAAGDLAVAVTSGCGAGAALRACGNAGTSGIEAVTLEDLPAGTYHALVEGVGGYAGAFTPALTVRPPPGNDLCAAATPIAPGATLAGQTLVAAADDVAASCAPGPAPTRDVFYAIDTRALGTTVVDLTVASPGLAPAIALLSGCGGAERACAASPGDGESLRVADLPPGEYVVTVEGPPAGGAGAFDLTFTAQPVPANNSCVAPADLLPGVPVTNGTLVTATDDLAGSCGGAGGGDVVYGPFTLLDPGRVRASATRTSGAFDPVLYLRSGACDGAEPAGACSATPGGASEVLDVEALPPGDYWIVVDSAGGAAGTFELLVEILPVPPANDRCAGAAPLPEGAITPGTTYGARDDTTGSCSAGGAEVFYAFTLASRRRVVLHLGSPSGQHALYLQQPCGAPASEVACVATATDDELLDVVDLGPGTYAVAVEAEAAPGGAFDLLLETFDPVTEDTCVAAALLTPGAPLLDRNSVGAHDDVSGTCAGASPTPDLVFTYALPDTRHVTLTAGASYDAALSVRAGGCADGIELACAATPAAAGPGTLTLPRQPAGTYHAILDGIGGASGTADLLLETVAPGAGDSCADGPPTLATGTTNDQALGAAYADDASASCGGAGGRDRIYTFNTLTAKAASLATRATAPHALTLRGGPSCAAAVQVGCQASVEDGGVHGAQIDLANLPAGTYWVVVDLTTPGAAATFEIDFVLSDPVLPPVNDGCAGAIALVDGAEMSGTFAGAADDTLLGCATAGRPDVYYRFTLAAPARVIAESFSSFDTALALRSDCATELQCADLTSGGEAIDVGYLPAGTYTLVAEKLGGSASAFSVRYRTLVPRPLNDGCAAARTLTPGATLAGETTAGASDDDDPSCGDATSADVVYAFAIPAGANARARVTVSGATGFDPVLTLQGATCGGAELACAQARTDGTEVLDEPNLAPGTYHVWVDALGGGAGSFNVLLELLPAVPPPSNDTCAGSTAALSGSTVGALDDYDLSCVADDGRDTVHGFSIASAAAVLVSLAPTDPAGWGLAACVRAAASCASGPDLGCTDGGFATRYLNRPSLAAGSYRVIVDGTSGESGAYTIAYEARAADATFGYWAIDTTGNTYVPLTGATEVTIPRSTGSSASPGDEWMQEVVFPEGFTFPFFGATRTSVTVSSNLYLTFTAGANAYTNECGAYAGAPNDLIAAFWDDGITRVESGAALLTKLEGEAPHRRFVLEFKNWDLLSCNGTSCTVLDVAMSHQVALHENGDVELLYGPRQAPSSSLDCAGGTATPKGTQHYGLCATIGLQSATGADVDAVQCNTTSPSVTQGRALYFVHPR